MKRDRRFWIGSMCLVVGLLCARVAIFADDAGRADQSPRKPGAAGGHGTAVSDARALAGQIDRLLAARWALARVQPARAADDAEFLRRVYLDLVGMIPTAAEACDFFDDPSPDKRAVLVESLLESPAYLTHTTEAYRMLLLPEADSDGGLGAAVGTFEAWLRKKVAEDAGYDQIVREVLTVRLAGQGRRGGNAHDPRAEPSPLAYYLAKGAKPENLAAGTARTFLGVRLECAQCHIIRSITGSEKSSGAWLHSSRGFRRRARTTRSARYARLPAAASWRFPRQRQIVPARVPRRGQAEVGPPGFRPRVAGRLGHRPGEPVFRPRGGQPRLGPVLRHGDRRAGRRPSQGQPAVAPRASRLAGKASSGRTATSSSS